MANKAKSSGIRPGKGWFWAPRPLPAIRLPNSQKKNFDRYSCDIRYEQEIKILNFTLKISFSFSHFFNFLNEILVIDDIFAHDILIKNQ